VNLKLVSDRVLQLGKAAGVFVRLECLAAPFAQDNLVVNQVEESIGIVPQVGVTFQESLDEDALALRPSAVLFGEELFLAIRRRGAGRGSDRGGSRLAQGNFDRLMARPDQGDAGGQLGVVDLRQPLAGRTAGLDGGGTLLRVVAMHLQVHGDKTFQQATMRGVEVTLRDQDLAHRPGLVPCPGIEGHEQRTLVDQAGLEREQAEKQVTVNFDPGHE